MMTKSEIVLNKRQNLGIYIHIPFCIKKCQYCDFLSVLANKQIQRKYLEQLLLEIEGFREYANEYIVDTIFIGGGTPSILQGEWIEQILYKIYSTFPAIESEKGSLEITIEANPGTVTEEKLFSYKRAGINRLSVGLQSADDKELSVLGRIHTWEQFLQSYDLMLSNRFTNVNVDIMSALPGQTVTSYEKTLEKVIQLKPQHISAYSLIIEEGTPFFEQYGNEEKKRQKGQPTNLLPTEEQERKMYQLTKQMLQENGYQRYEISNYAKEGFACRHNIGYWNGKEYIGFGLGAASLIKNRRFTKTKDLDTYLGGAIQECNVQVLSERDQMEEFVFLGMRLMEGISKEKFQDCFGIGLEEIYGTVLSKLMREDLIQVENDRIRLTERGIDVSNYVFGEFLL